MSIENNLLLNYLDILIEENNIIIKPKIDDNIINKKNIIINFEFLDLTFDNSCNIVIKQKLNNKLENVYDISNSEIIENKNVIKTEYDISNSEIIKNKNVTKTEYDISNNEIVENKENKENEENEENEEKKIHHTKNIINYYVIHCDEHRERLNHIEEMKQNLGQPINIFKGFYTKNVGMDFKSKLDYVKTIDNNLKMEQNTFHSPGEIGCYLSHHMLVKYLKENINENYSVIFEDDTIIYNEVDEQINNVISNLNNLNVDWDIVFLGNMEGNKGNNIIDRIYTINDTYTCTGTHALLINNKNASRLYNIYCNIIHAIDHQININVNKKNLNGYVIYPPICYQNRNLVSNIQNYNG